MDNQESIHGIVLKWIDVPEITPHSGHGVDFMYGNESAVHEKPISLGFIEGYTWHHKKRGKQLIYILSKDSKIWGIINEDPISMINELKKCIYLVLKDERLHGQITPSIYAWFNA